MRGINLSELTYQIQEDGGGPEIWEALVRQFAPGVFHFAVDLHPDGPDRLDDALGLTAETFRTALADHRRLREFDSIRNWLFATLIGLDRGANRRGAIHGRRMSGQRRLALILRFGHHLSVDDIAEILGTFPAAAHRHIRRGRRTLAGLHRPPRFGHITPAIDEAVDRRINWNELPDPMHLDNCDVCRDYLGALQGFEKNFSAELELERPATLLADAMRAIQEHIEGRGEILAARSRGLPIREAAWAAGAVAVFLLLFVMLNPVLSIDPPEREPTPTHPPADPASDGIRPPDYAQLEERLAVWELWTRWLQTGTITGEFPSTTEIAFSVSGHYGAFGSFNDAVLWDLAAGVEIPLEGHESVVTALAFGGDAWLATGSEDGTVRVWDVAGGRARFVLEGGPRPVSSVAFSAENALLAAGGNSGVTIWRFTAEGLLESARLEGDFIRGLAFSPDGELFAAADRGGAIQIWRLPGFEQVIRFAARQRFNTGMAFSPNGSRLATASMDGSVKVFRLAVTGREFVSAEHIFTLDHPTWVSDVTWIGDQLLLTVAGSFESSVTNLGKRGVYFWEMATGLPAALPLFLENDGGVLTALQVGPDQINLGSYNRAVHTLHLVPTFFGSELYHFARSDSSLFPPQIDAQTLPEPSPVQSYPLDSQAALELIGYAQVLTPVLDEAIPDRFIRRGAAYDHVTSTATFAFTRSFALDHEEWVFLRIRRIDAENLTLFKEDWIGLGAQINQLQIGSAIGERVRGEWLPAAVDSGAPGILRWADTPLTRFRWTQNGFLIELLSRSEIGTEITRWNSLFLPIALALIGADEESELIDYTVVEGDTCTGIAARFGTTVGRIVGLNTLDPDCTILSGQDLRLPLPPAFGTTIESDLDCDGVVERLRSIPDPQQRADDLSIGFILEDIPGESSGAGLEYAPFWTFSIVDIDVTFFETPIPFSVEADCPRFLAIAGFGGSGEESGLRIFSWDGEEMTQVLAADGFLYGAFPAPGEPFWFQTRSLEYDQSENACTERLTTYEWRDGAFVQTARATNAGVECFTSAP